MGLRLQQRQQVFRLSRMIHLVQVPVDSRTIDYIYGPFYPFVITGTLPMGHFISYIGKNRLYLKGISINIIWVKYLNI